MSLSEKDPPPTNSHDFTATEVAVEDSLSSDVAEATEDGDDEPNWPKEWRAYACLTGCFFLMFNSWGLVNAYGMLCEIFAFTLVAHLY